MAGEPESFQTCAECGATVYPEHVQEGLAVEREGKLVCSYCAKTVVALPPAGAAAGNAPLQAGTDVASDDPMILAEEPPSATDAREATSIRAFGGAATIRTRGAHLSRPLLQGVPAATRCRTFHCKLTDAAIGHMNDQIDEWADSDDHIEIKFATSCIGIVEGKHNDPHLIVTVFY